MVLFSSFLSSLFPSCVLSLLVLDACEDVVDELEDDAVDVLDVEDVDELAERDVEPADVPDGWLALLDCTIGVVVLVSWMTEFSTATTGLVSDVGVAIGGGAGTSGGKTGWHSGSVASRRQRLVLEITVLQPAREELARHCSTVGRTAVQPGCDWFAMQLLSEGKTAEQPA